MRTVVALYDKIDDARRALQALVDAGFHRDDMNLIVSDSSGEYSRLLESTPNEGMEGAAAGAGIGAALGGLGGLLVGLGALAIPGIGPVVAAGPIVAALAGAGVGAVAGGLIGALTELGIPEVHANYYAEGIRRGGSLVILRSEDTMAENARMILNRFSPIDIDTRATMWAGEGWKGFGKDEADMPHDRRAGDAKPFEGAGSDLETTDNVTGSRIGENYPRPNFDQDSETEMHNRERDLGDRIPEGRIPTGEDREHMRSGANMGIPVTGDEEDFDDERDDRARETGDVAHMDKHMRDDVFGRDRAGMGDQDIPITGGTISEVDNRMSGYGNLETDPHFDAFSENFRADYQARYAMTGHSYDFYSPAYLYGYDLGLDETYRVYDWERLEPEARRDWEQRGLKAAWEDVKDAVKHAWESVRH